MNVKSPQFISRMLQMILTGLIGGVRARARNSNFEIKKIGDLKIPEDYKITKVLAPGNQRVNYIADPLYKKTKEVIFTSKVHKKKKNLLLNNEGMVLEFNPGTSKTQVFSTQMMSSTRIIVNRDNDTIIFDAKIFPFAKKQVKINFESIFFVEGEFVYGVDESNIGLIYNLELDKVERYFGIGDKEFNEVAEDEALFVNGVNEDLGNCALDRHRGGFVCKQRGYVEHQFLFLPVRESSPVKFIWLNFRARSFHSYENNTLLGCYGDSRDSYCEIYDFYENSSRVILMRDTFPGNHFGDYDYSIEPIPALKLLTVNHKNGTFGFYDLRNNGRFLKEIKPGMGKGNYGQFRFSNNSLQITLQSSLFDFEVYQLRREKLEIENCGLMNFNLNSCLMCDKGYKRVVDLDGTHGYNLTHCKADKNQGGGNDGLGGDQLVGYLLDDDYDIYPLSGVFKDRFLFRFSFPGLAKINSEFTGRRIQILDEGMKNLVESGDIEARVARVGQKETDYVLKLIFRKSYKGGYLHFRVVYYENHAARRSMEGVSVKSKRVFYVPLTLADPYIDKGSDRMIRRFARALYFLLVVVIIITFVRIFSMTFGNSIQFLRYFKIILNTQTIIALSMLNIHFFGRYDRFMKIFFEEFFYFGDESDMPFIEGANVPGRVALGKASEFGYLAFLNIISFFSTHIYCLVLSLTIVLSLVYLCLSQRSDRKIKKAKNEKILKILTNLKKENEALKDLLKLVSGVRLTIVYINILPSLSRAILLSRSYLTSAFLNKKITTEDSLASLGSLTLTSIYLVELLASFNSPKNSNESIMSAIYPKKFTSFYIFSPEIFTGYKKIKQKFKRAEFASWIFLLKNFTLCSLVFLSNGVQESTTSELKLAIAMLITTLVCLLTSISVQCFVTYNSKSRASLDITRHTCLTIFSIISLIPPLHHKHPFLDVTTAETISNLLTGKYIVLFLIEFIDFVLTSSLVAKEQGIFAYVESKARCYLVADQKNFYRNGFKREYYCLLGTDRDYQGIGFDNLTDGSKSMVLTNWNKNESQKGVKKSMKICKDFLENLSEMEFREKIGKLSAKDFWTLMNYNDPDLRNKSDFDMNSSIYIVDESNEQNAIDIGRLLKSKNNSVENSEKSRGYENNEELIVNVNDLFLKDEEEGQGVIPEGNDQENRSQGAIKDLQLPVIDDEEEEKQQQEDTIRDGSIVIQDISFPSEEQVRFEQEEQGIKHVNKSIVKRSFNVINKSSFCNEGGEASSRFQQSNGNFLEQKGDK